MRQAALLQEVTLQSLHQAVHGKHQFTTTFRLVFVSREIDRLAHHVLVTSGQRQMLIRLAQGAQQTPDRLRLRLRTSHPRQGLRRRDFPGLGLLQSVTIKLPTPHGTLLIRRAKSAIKAGTSRGWAYSR